MKVKKFVYKYQRFLNIREIEEKKEHSTLIKIRKRKEEKRLKKQEKEEELKEVQHKVNSLKTFTIDDLKYYNSHISALEKEKEKLVKDFKKFEKKEIEQKKKLLEVSKAKKILQKLKEKHKEAFYKREEKLNNKILDELGTQKFLNKRGKDD
ncbi:MAG: flagellar export protein FliJ [Candidatus Muiribacteriota bacterium]